MKRILQLAAAVALAFSPSIYAAATQELTLSDGTGDSITVDQDGNIVSTTGTVSIVAGNIAVDDLGSIHINSDSSGAVCIGGTAGAGQTCSAGFKINTASAFGLGDSIAPQLQDEESLDTSSSGSGTLTITYTDTTYENVGPGIFLSGSESTSNTPTTTVTFTAFGSSGAVIPAGTTIGSLGPLTGASANANASFTNPDPTGSESITSVSSITFASAGAFNTTFDIATVPEPTSIVLLGSLLLGLAAITRKRFAKQS